MKLKFCLFFLSVGLFSSLVLADGIPGETKSTATSSIKAKENRPSLSEKDLLPYQYCGKDSDCMAVINGCCQCMQGDSFVAINKERLIAFQERFNCEDILCPKAESVSYSCEDGVVTCVSNRCRYVEPK